MREAGRARREPVGQLKKAPCVLRPNHHLGPSRVDHPGDILVALHTLPPPGQASQCWQQPSVSPSLSQTTVSRLSSLGRSWRLLFSKAKCLQHICSRICDDILPIIRVIPLNISLRAKPSRPPRSVKEFPCLPLLKTAVTKHSRVSSMGLSGSQLLPQCVSHRGHLDYIFRRKSSEAVEPQAF